VAGAGKHVRYEELDSPHGHDAFLKEWDQLTTVMTPFMDAWGA
jgi:homoserine O-acetyltransferase